MTGGVAAPSGGSERREAAFTGDKTMRDMRSRLVQAIAAREIRTAVGNGRSPARKRKLNEKMLRSSEAEMPTPPLGAVINSAAINHGG